MPDEINLNEEEEAALERAERKREEAKAMSKTVRLMKPGKTVDDPPVEVGRITWDGKALRGEPDGPMMQAILETPMGVMRNKRAVPVTADKEPEAWLAALPYHFRSGYLWAEPAEEDS